MMSGMAYASAMDNAEVFNEVNDADFCHGCERKGAMGRMETGTLSLPMNAVFIDDEGGWTFCAFFDALADKANTLGEDMVECGRGPVGVGGAMQQVSMLIIIILVLITLH